MATNIGQAYVQIVPTAQGITGAVEAALGDDATKAGQKSGANFSAAMGKGIATAGAVTAAAAAAAAAAIAGATKAIVDGTGQVAAYGDNIDKMSQKMGLSAVAYQEWDAIMQHSGTSIDAMKRGMTTLAQQAEKGSDAFQRLGISQEELAGMNQEELFARVISGLQGMEAGTERTAIAQQLLGGSSKELGALLNTSAADTEAMRQKVHELGGVMSDEAVKAAAHYQDSLQDMTTAFAGAKRGLMSEFLPSITTVMDGLTALFSGDQSGINTVNQGVTSFVDTLSNVLPQAIEIGSQIVVSLSSAIIGNLDKLMVAGYEAIKTLGAGIMDNLPLLLDMATQILVDFATNLGAAAPTIIPDAVNMIIDTIIQLLNNVDALVDGAIALVIGLTEGIINALPILIERLPEIIVKLTEALIMNAPKLALAGPQIMIALITGVISAIPQLLILAPQIISELSQMLITEAPRMIESGKEQINKLIEGIRNLVPTLMRLPGEIINNFANTFLNVGQSLRNVGEQIGEFLHDGISALIDKAVGWGKDLIDNFISGITSGIDGIKDAVSDAADAVADFLHFSEPDKGPLSNFHTFAPDMMELFAKGIKDNANLITSQIQDSFNFEDDIKASAVNLEPNTTTTPAASSGSMVQNLTINAPKALDPSEIARQTKNANRAFVLQLRTT